MKKLYAVMLAIWIACSGFTCTLTYNDYSRSYDDIQCENARLEVLKGDEQHSDSQAIDDQTDLKLTDKILGVDGP